MNANGSNSVTQQKVSDDFDSFVDDYCERIDDAIAFSGFKSDFFVKVKCDYLLRLTAREMGPNSGLNMLDLGCGVGNYHPSLVGQYKSLSGIDVSERSVAYARRHNPAVRYDTYPGGRLPYEDASFDVAFTSCVMHHVPVPQWEEFVGEMRRVIRPGGMAVVFEHNPWNPVTRRIVSTCPIDADAVLLRPSKTRDLFEKAGFQNVRTRSILTIPPVRPFLFGVDETLGLLGVGAQYYLTARKPMGAPL